MSPLYSSDILSDDAPSCSSSPIHSMEEYISGDEVDYESEPEPTEEEGDKEEEEKEVDEEKKEEIDPKDEQKLCFICLELLLNMTHTPENQPHLANREVSNRKSLLQKYTKIGTQPL